MVRVHLLVGSNEDMLSLLSTVYSCRAIRHWKILVLRRTFPGANAAIADERIPGSFTPEVDPGAPRTPRSFFVPKTPESDAHSPHTPEGLHTPEPGAHSPHSPSAALEEFDGTIGATLLFNFLALFC